MLPLLLFSQVATFVLHSTLLISDSLGNSLMLCIESGI